MDKEDLYGIFLDDINVEAPTDYDRSELLLDQYENVLDNMVANGVDYEAALGYALELQDLNMEYAAGNISLDERDARFYDDFYDPLDQDYGYDFHEKYEGEGG